MGSGRRGRAGADPDTVLVRGAVATGARLSSADGRTDEAMEDSGEGPVAKVSDSGVREWERGRGREEEGGRGAVIELRRGDVPWTPLVRLSNSESMLACKTGRETEINEVREQEQS